MEFFEISDYFDSPRQFDPLTQFEFSMTREFSSNPLQDQINFPQFTKTPQSMLSQSKRRSNNTIFKTGTSFYNKILKQSKNKALNQHIKKLYKDSQKKINFATFPKLMALAEFYGVLHQSRDNFYKNMNNLLQKKRGEINQARFLQLENNIKKIARALQCNNWKEAINQYWGESRQLGKFQKSLKQIIDFRGQLMR